MKKFTPSRKVYRMLKKWDTSLTRQGLARKLNTSLGTVNNLKKLYGLCCQSKRSLINASIIKLYRKGTSIQEFSKLSGLSYAAAKSFLVRNNLPHERTRNLIAKQNLNYFLVALLQSHGFTYEAIGRLYKVSRQRIEHVLKRKLI